MIAPQNRPANVLQLIVAADAVGISSVNIPAGAQYCDIDTGAIAKAQAAGAKNVTSVETTHGVIRSKWPERHSSTLRPYPIGCVISRTKP
jgi:hypothetical protein